MFFFIGEYAFHHGLYGFLYGLFGFLSYFALLLYMRILVELQVFFTDYMCFLLI